VNSLPKIVTRQRRDCDLNPGPSAPESSTLTTRLPSHPQLYRSIQYNQSMNNTISLIKHNHNMTWAAAINRLMDTNQLIKKIIKTIDRLVEKVLPRNQKLKVSFNTGNKTHIRIFVCF